MTAGVPGKRKEKRNIMSSGWGKEEWRLVVCPLASGRSIFFLDFELYWGNIPKRASPATRSPILFFVFYWSGFDTKIPRNSKSVLRQLFWLSPKIGGKIIRQSGGGAYTGCYKGEKSKISPLRFLGKLVCWTTRWLFCLRKKIKVILSLPDGMEHKNRTRLINQKRLQQGLFIGTILIQPIISFSLTLFFRSKLRFPRQKIISCPPPPHLVHSGGKAFNISSSSSSDRRRPDFLAR